MKPHAILTTVLILCLSAQAHAGAVIVAADAQIAELGRQQVRRIFLGRESSIGAQTATVIYQTDGAVREEFEHKVLDKTSAEVTGYWAKLIFTGKARAPIEVADDDAVKAMVGRTPGAIGYIADSAVDSSVRVLLRF